MSGSVTYEFEDLPLHSFNDGANDWNYEILAHGRAEIEYDREGEWRVGDIELAASRKVAGIDRWEERHFWLDRSDPFFSAISAALVKHRTDEIDEAVGDDMVENGIHIPTPREEHGTINHRQLGLER